MHTSLQRLGQLKSLVNGELTSKVFRLGWLISVFLTLFSGRSWVVIRQLGVYIQGLQHLSLGHTLRIFRRLIFLSLGLSILSLGLSSPVFAASRILLVVKGLGAGTDKAAALVRQAARNALSSDVQRVEQVVELGSRLEQPTADEASRALRNAEDYFLKAQKFYESFDLDKSVENLQAAVNIYEKNAAYLRDFKQVANTFMLLGATYILRGEEKLGADFLSQAVSVYPTVIPDPIVFNPKMRKIFQKQVDTLSKKGESFLSIDSTPSNSEVYLDGNFVGVAPLILRNIMAGKHYLRLQREGYASFGKVINLVPQKETSEVVSLKVLTPSKPVENFSRLTDRVIFNLDKDKKIKTEDVEQIGALIGAERLLFMGVRFVGDKVNVQAAEFNLNSRTRSDVISYAFIYEEQPLTYNKEIANLLYQNFGPDSKQNSWLPSPNLVPASTDVADREDTDDPTVRHYRSEHSCLGMSCKKVKTWVVILSESAGVGLTVAGAVYWSGAKADNQKYRDSMQNKQATLDLRAQGMHKENMSYVFFASGAVAMFTGLCVGLLWDTTPTVKEVVELTPPVQNSFKAMVTPTWDGQGGVATFAWSF